MVSGFNFWAIYRLSGICGILLWLYRYTDKSLDVSIWWIIAENFGQCVSWSAVGLGEKILEMPSFNLPPHGYRLQNGDAWLPKNTCRKCWFTAKARFFWRATLRVQRRYCTHPMEAGERTLITLNTDESPQGRSNLRETVALLQPAVRTHHAKKSDFSNGFENVS